MTKGEYPNFGSPECRCSKCMFHKVACNPSGKNVVGCFHGWKIEESSDQQKLQKLADVLQININS